MATGAFSLNSHAIGNCSTALGFQNTAHGSYSLVEGLNNKTFGSYSHVEGLGNNILHSFTSMTESVVVDGVIDSVDSCDMDYHGTVYIKFASFIPNTSPTINIPSSTCYYIGKIVGLNNGLTLNNVLIYYDNYDFSVYYNSNSLMNFTGEPITITFEKTEMPPSTEAMHVQGKYSLIDSNYAHVVGNGSSETNRSNAHTLDWEGNATFAGDVTATDTNGNLVSLLDVASKSGNNKILYVGTCSTSASTPNKIVTISNFKLEVGVEVYVKFTYTNTSSSSTLNISSTGEKQIYYKNGDRMYYIPADIYHKFIYDGSHWVYLSSDNAIIGARSNERYGLKMSGSALVPAVSGYGTSLGSTSSKIGNIYANNIGSDGYPTGYIYGSNVYANYLYTKTGSYRTRVLPPLPLLYGHFIVPSYHQITLNSEICVLYGKSLYTGFIGTSQEVSTNGCAEPLSPQGNLYDVAFIFRLVGYDSSNTKKAVPFVHEFALSTSYLTNECGDNSTDWYIFRTPCGHSVYFSITGINVNENGCISGTPTLNINGTTSNVHFSEISLMP